MHAIFEFIEPTTFALALLTILCAYFIFGISGFGSSIVAVPLLVQIYPLKIVVPMMVLIDLSASFYLGRKFSNTANKQELKWLFPFTLAGMAAGIFLLVNAPSKPLLVTLGIFAVANGARTLLQKGTMKQKPINKWWAVPFGVCGGMFTALFATGGPIYASYLNFRLSDPRVIRATMAFAIFMLTFLRLLFMLISGLILSWPIFGLALCLIPAMIAGVGLGSHVHSKMTHTAMRVTYGSILLFSGISLLVKQWL